MQKDFDSLTAEIKQEMLRLHLDLKANIPPNNRDIHRLSQLFYQRDKDPHKEHDLELNHVMRGFQWGMQAMLQIYQGSNLKET